MHDLIENPAAQAALLPFIAGLVAAACLRRTSLLGLAVSAGLLVLVAVTTGFSFEPMTSQRKLVVGALVVAALVPVLERIPERSRVHAARLVAVAAGLAAVWMVLRVLQQKETGPALAAGAGAAAFMMVLVISVQRVGAQPIPAAAASIGLGLAAGAMAVFGASALLGQMGIAIAAAAGAVLVMLVASRRPVPPSWTLALPAGVMGGLIGLLAVFTGVLPWYGLAPVLAVPWATRLVSIADRPAWLAGLLVTAAAVAPAALAIALAWLVPGSPSA